MFLAHLETISFLEALERSRLGVKIQKTIYKGINPLSANPKKYSNTLKQLLSVFDHFVRLALKGLKLVD